MKPFKNVAEQDTSQWVCLVAQTVCETSGMDEQNGEVSDLGQAG